MAALQEPLLLYALLVVAVAAGFLLGRRRVGANAAGSSSETLPAETLRGLAHLLDDAPDQAAATLAERLDINADSLDTHLVLATLLRRRGEVEQAIRIHQRLLASRDLGRRQLARVELELARDYLTAGLLDRAEALLGTLAADPALQDDARLLLLDVYERERDWDEAIAVARRLSGRNRSDVRTALAQYLCERAEQFRGRGDLLGARRLLRDALAQDDQCVRASLLLGRVELAAGNRRDALKSLRRVAVQAPAFVPEALDDLARCFPLQGPTRRGWLNRGEPADSWRRVLERLHEDVPSMAVTCRLAECIEQDEGPAAAHDWLASQLARAPSVLGLDHLLALRLRAQLDVPVDPDATPGSVPAGAMATTDLTILKRFVETLAARGPRYRCSDCGLAGQLLHWQCPSCRSWGTTAPADEAAPPA